MSPSSKETLPKKDLRSLCEHLRARANPVEVKEITLNSAETILRRAALVVEEAGAGMMHALYSDSDLQLLEEYAILFANQMYENKVPHRSRALMRRLMIRLEPQLKS